MKKKLLIENEIQDLTDFQKILLLNKRKLDFNDVKFLNSKREDFDNIIEMTPHGLLFHFDDLEQFLKFFFPETYEEGSDGEWDAVNYDRMYYNQYDFYSECQDRAYDDWREGYTLGYFCGSAAEKLKTLVSILDPKLSEDKGIFIDRGGRLGLDDYGGAQVSTLLETYFKNIGDEIDEIICTGKDRSIRSGAEELIRDTFCDGLRQFGIENWGKSRLTNCFKTYFISWASLVQMYVDKAEFDEQILDLLFQVTEQFRNHPPQAYEIEHNVWDNEIFENETCERLVILMDEYIERAYEEFSPKYMEAIQKLSRLELFGKKQIPGTKTFIKVNSVDPETLQVKYQVGEGSWFSNIKYGQSTVDEVITMATQPGLFDPTEFRISPSDLKNVGYYRPN